MTVVQSLRLFVFMLGKEVSLTGSVVSYVSLRGLITFYFRCPCGIGHGSVT